jgi:hypothetical protein
VNPNPDRVREKLKGAIALEQALGWVREGDHRDGPHMHILDLLPVRCLCHKVNVAGLTVCS